MPSIKSMASIKSKTDWISVFAVAKKSDWWRNVVYLVKVDPFRIRVSLWCPALFDIWLNCFQFFFTRLSLTFHTYVSTTISFFCLFPSGLIFFLSTRVAKKKKKRKKEPLWKCAAQRKRLSVPVITALIKDKEHLPICCCVIGGEKMVFQKMEYQPVAALVSANCFSAFLFFLPLF